MNTTNCNTAEYQVYDGRSPTQGTRTVPGEPRRETLARYWEHGQIKRVNGLTGEMGKLSMYETHKNHVCMVLHGYLHRDLESL